MKRLVLALLLLVGLMSFTPQLAFAAETAQDAVCEGLGAVSGTNGCEQADGEEAVDSILITVVNILSIIGATIAVIMIIIAGIRFVTSSGDSGSTATARNTIIYAVVGLVIIALSQLIVRFVVERVSPTPTSEEDSMLVEPLHDVA